MYFKQNIFIVFSFLITLTVFSQKKNKFKPSTPDSLSFYYFFEKNIDSSNNYKVYNVDTSLHNFQFFDPASRCYDFYSSLGNIGLATRNNIFNINQNFAFDYGVHSFDPYIYQNDNIKYYSSLSPYTRLFYSMGSKKEQMFQVTHSHVIKRQLTIAADFRIINSIGRYSFRQSSNNKNAYFTAYYNTRNKKFGFLANFIYNNVKVQENGGITNDTLYENYRKGLSDSSCSIFLKNAMSKLRDFSFYFKGYFELHNLNKFLSKDTTIKKPNHKYNIGRLNFTSLYRNQKFKYEDGTINPYYYDNIYFDTVSSKDSVIVYTLENSFYWSNNDTRSDGSPRNLRIEAGSEYNYHEIKYIDSTRKIINNIIPFVKLRFSFFNGHYFTGSFKYLIGIFHPEAYHANASIFKKIIFKEKKFGALYFKASFSSLNSACQPQYYYSNFFQWDNNFRNQKILNLDFGYQYPKLNIGASFSNLSNYIYYDSLALPAQSGDKPLTVINVYLKKNFDFGIFGLDNNFSYQYSDNNIINVPMFSGKQTYYLKGSLFKKALYAEIGFNLNYNTLYYADNYMPVTKIFYTQNSVPVGNYLYADVFLNLKIKRAFLFVMLQHVNAGLMGYNYFTTPHYPMQDRMFRFGVSWWFFN